MADGDNTRYRICGECLVEKPWTDFSPTRHGRPRKNCKECTNKSRRKEPPSEDELHTFSFPNCGKQKTCSECGEVKSACEFHSHRSGRKHGRRCRECRRKAAATYRPNHPAFIAPIFGDIRATHFVCESCGNAKLVGKFYLTLSGLPLRLKCRACSQPTTGTQFTELGRICSCCRIDKPSTDFSFMYREAGKRQHICKMCVKENTDYVAAAERANRWYYENIERAKVANADWREANPAYQRDQYWSFPEVRRSKLAHAAKRRAAEIGAEGSHTGEDVERLIELQRRRCANCVKELNFQTPRQVHVDHIIALQPPLDSGAKVGTNDFYNLQLLCQTCNCQKKNRDPIEFRNSQGFLL